ncbi:right-handed parallel beta-helix repeat-containing protein [Aquimarina agarilytica]|uniref:right-handed parallel beta-helix repeat-containing protein n=1 Tax=Aquimarina agarilytica TaxID=1087449 RepID=UPI0012FAD009|nr:right-handed parallel beta-helix repeat-containing protein [Aquimarina agarilytica]
MKKKIIKAFCLFFCLIIRIFSAQAQKVKSFDLSIAADATASVLSTIQSIDEEGVTVTFEKGTYHFYPDKGLEQFCHISNHDDVFVYTAMPIFNKKGLTIDGNGATFIFHGLMIPFLIDHSEDITLKNFSIDWAMSFHSEMEVVAVNKKDKTIDFRISKEYPYEIRNGQLYFIKEYYEHSIGQAIYYDPDRNAIAFDTEAYGGLTNWGKAESRFGVEDIQYKYKIDKRSKFHGKLGTAHSLVVKELEPGLVRVYNHRKKMPKVGLILATKGSQKYNRVAPAVRVTWTKEFNMNNVSIHHAGGMGVIAENSENLTLDAVKVTPSKGRMVSTTADATHFVGCRGKVVLKNCVFNNQLDDASNVHGTYQEIIDVLGPNQLGVRMGHYQQQGFVIGKEGDKIGLVRLSNSFYHYDELTIKSIKKVNRRYQVITFNETLSKDVKSGDLIENLDAYPYLEVVNCDISRNRARGLLLSTPKGALIEGNYFHTEMEALLIPVESGHWYESGNANNLIIKNNTFEDCQHSGFNRGVIRLVTDDDNENIAFNNIEITNNTFKHFDNLILQIANTNHLLFQGNTIANSKKFKALHNQNEVIQIKSSKGIVFKNNRYKGKAKKMITTEGLSESVNFN